MANLAEKPIEGEIVPHVIAAYNPYRAQIAEMKEINAKTVFQYHDPKGNKEARGYIHKLRLSKGEVERVRKAEKAASLEYGRRVDSEAKALTEEIEAMIAVHQAPLDEIEEREKARVAEIRKKIDGIAVYKECAGHDSQEIRNALATLSAVVVDAEYAEFRNEAETTLADAIAAQQAELVIAEKREADAAELKRLQEAEAARIQKEREDKIAAEAAEKARLEAEAKAKAEREAIERKAKEESEAAEKREAQLKADAEAAEKRAAEAAKAESERIQKAADDKAAEDAKREADKKHQASIHAEIITALGVVGIGEEQAKAAIVAIRKGEVPHIKIVY